MKDRGEKIVKAKANLNYSLSTNQSNQENDQSENYPEKNSSPQKPKLNLDLENLMNDNVLEIENAEQFEKMINK